MPLTDAQRRANGQSRLVVWLPAATVTKLDDICAESGYSRADMVETMIETDHETLLANRRAYQIGEMARGKL